MATIVVHGTLPGRAAKHYSWWHDSWGEDGFLNALAGGMLDAAGGHDVWRVGDAPVQEIPDLGFFVWSGALAGFARDAGSTGLVKYLNKIADLSGERLCIVAHSHGCNVVKNASSHRKLRARIDKAVFLACPHFVAKGHAGAVYTYRLNPQRVGSVLNVYSRRDSVQVGLASKFTGPFGARLADFLPQEATACDTDPQARSVYRNLEVTTEGEGEVAHETLHGSLVGRVAGLWLNEGLGRGRLPTVPAWDVGA
jgi:hypothetical protein